ncbi:MAG TPA: hypothetical protein DCS93_44705 [Microscillaceae bacterium]|nr:hypothetical protein [Microscillaceae bacterium]
MKRNFFFAILFLIVLTGWASSLSTPAQQKTKSATEQSKKRRKPMIPLGQSWGSINIIDYHKISRHE